MDYYLIMTKPLLVDTHAHLNFNAYKDDADEVIKRTLDGDVWMINVGAEYKTSQRAVDYAQKYPQGVYAAVGLHPIHLEEQVFKEKVGDKEVEHKTKKEEFDLDRYQTLAQNEKVVAIGEIGLDYKVIDRNKETEAKEKQKQVFLEQLDLARQLDKPIIIHCRQAYDDLLEILNAFQSGCASCPFACPGAGASQLKGVIHCFVSNLDEAKRFLELGLLLGFNGMITFSNQYDEAIKEIPLEKILLETDCPYLTPLPYRGKRNEPLYVKYVAEKIAQIKNISFEEVVEQTTKNARELFGI
jgi:TatD DNase family protein